eukprot:TRINITY_DN4096_c0_g1_i3.p1 TRINITY_DN4096_c0_g1~~TRINITY_DN4096_c0_g1_i3.p1  ORF type:complete len:510 (+),score=109.75 TRINITY_DN4096_c0_g1_i3:43-1572(+)
MPQRCNAITAGGYYCKNSANEGNEYCAKHVRSSSLAPKSPVAASATPKTPTQRTPRARSTSKTPVARRTPSAGRAAAIVAEAPKPESAPEPVMTETKTTGLSQWLKNPRLFSKQRLANMSLGQYKYQGVDLSPVALHVLHPFWDFVVSLVPTSVAANLLTLFGGLSYIVGYLLITWYNPTFHGTSPWWVYTVGGVTLFMYQTFDGIDGKQARRTKMQSPLGEMLDHGVDSVYSMLGLMSIATSVQIGANLYLFLFVILLTMVPFYIVQWESYHTHKMVLWYVNGPTEGLLLESGLFHALGLLTYLGSDLVNIFIHPAADVLRVYGVPGADLVQTWFGGMQLNHFLILSFYLPFSIGQSAVSFIEVWRHVRAEKGSFLDALALLLPLFAITVVSSVFVVYREQLFAQNPHQVLLLVGFAIANMVIRIIAGHRMGERPKFRHVPSIAVFIVVAHSFLPCIGVVSPIADSSLLLAGTIFNAVYFLGYMSFLVKEFLEHFDIPFLSVRKPAVA